MASHGASVLQHHFENQEQQKEASSLGMWVFLLTELMFFGGMFMAYLAYRQIYPESFAAASSMLNVSLGASNTVVLICSSLTMALAVRCAATGYRQMTVVFLTLTLLLGSTFLGIKGIEYHDKFVHHEVPGAQFPSTQLARGRGYVARQFVFRALLRHDRFARQPHDHRRRHSNFPDRPGSPGGLLARMAHPG